MKTSTGYVYMDKYISNVIKTKRIEKQIGLTELADSLDISKQRYFWYENGERSLPLDLYFKICKILDIDDEQLFTEAQDYMRKMIFDASL